MCSNNIILSRFRRQLYPIKRMEHGSLEQSGRSQDLQHVRRGQRLGDSRRAAEKAEVSNNAGNVFVIVSSFCHLFYLVHQIDSIKNIP